MTDPKPFRGAEIHISLELLLEFFGLERGSIHLSFAAVASYPPDTLLVSLYGDDKRLPVVERGCDWPTAIVVVEQHPDLPGVRGRLEWGRPA